MKNAGILLLASISVVACVDDRQVAELNGKVAASEGQIKALTEQVNNLNAELGKRISDLEINDQFQQWEHVAFLTPGSSGYAPIRFDLGTITVTLADVNAYANGSKVTLVFGNPLAARINGLRGTIEWGKVGPTGTPLNNEAKTKPFAPIESLANGSWTKIQIVLEGVPPSDLGFVRLRDMGHTGISLMR